MVEGTARSIRWRVHAPGEGALATDREADGLSPNDVNWGGDSQETGGKCSDGSGLRVAP